MGSLPQVLILSPVLLTGVTTTTTTLRNSTKYIADGGSKACHNSKSAMGNMLLERCKHAITTFADREEKTQHPV